MSRAAEDELDSIAPSAKKIKAAKPPKDPNAPKQPKKVPASHKMCKQCGKTVAPKKFTEECKATRLHSGEWDYDYDPPEGQRVRIDRGKWTCCGSTKCTQAGCKTGTPHEEGAHVPKKAQFLEFECRV